MEQKRSVYREISMNVNQDRELVMVDLSRHRVNGYYVNVFRV